MAKGDATSPEVLAAAFALIGEEGWRAFSFATLARRTGVPRVQLYREFDSRGALLGALSRRIDEAMLAVDEAEADRAVGKALHARLHRRHRYSGCIVAHSPWAWRRDTSCSQRSCVPPETTARPSRWTRSISSWACASL